MNQPGTNDYRELTTNEPKLNNNKIKTEFKKLVAFF